MGEEQTALKRRNAISSAHGETLGLSSNCKCRKLKQQTATFSPIEGFKTENLGSGQGRAKQVQEGALAVGVRGLMLGKQNPSYWRSCRLKKSIFGKLAQRGNSEPGGNCMHCSQIVQTAKLPVEAKQAMGIMLLIFLSIIWMKCPLGTSHCPRCREHSCEPVLHKALPQGRALMCS